jgi:hypothetical protein
MNAAQTQLMRSPAIAPLQRKIHAQVHAQTGRQSSRCQRSVKAGTCAVDHRWRIRRSDFAVEKLKGKQIKGPGKVAAGFAFDVEPKVGQLGIIPHKNLSTGQGIDLIRNAGVGHFFVQVRGRKAVEAVDLEAGCSRQAFFGPKVLGRGLKRVPHEQACPCPKGQNPGTVRRHGTGVITKD